jgi:hypothetical protein
MFAGTATRRQQFPEIVRKLVPDLRPASLSVMLFEARLREGLADGSVTMAFRRWRRPLVVAGGRYRTGGRQRQGMGDPIVEAERVDRVDPAKVTKADARRAGYRSPEALLASVRGNPEWPLYRIRFRLVDGPDPREVLASTPRLSVDDVAAIHARLDRLDRAAAPEEPWTARVLRLIAERPGVVSTDLAVEVGLERYVFKRRVRSLKELGLTTSLLVGYQLSPRGTAYLAARPTA